MPLKSLLQSKELWHIKDVDVLGLGLGGVCFIVFLLVLFTILTKKTVPIHPGGNASASGSWLLDWPMLMINFAIQ